MMSAAVAGTTFRPTPSYTTLRDVTKASGARPQSSASHNLLDVRHLRVYIRARDQRREELFFENGHFWIRPDPTRAHAVRRNAVWRTGFGDQIVLRYGFELRSGAPIRWDPDVVMLAAAVGRAMGSADGFVESALEERETRERDAAMFGDRPSLARELVLPPEVTPDKRDCWVYASLLAAHRTPAARGVAIWEAARVLFARLDLQTLREAVEEELPHLTRPLSEPARFRRRRPSAF